MGLTPLLDLSEDFFLPLKNKNVLKALQFNHTTAKRNYEQFSIKTSRTVPRVTTAHTFCATRDCLRYRRFGEHKTKVFSAACNNATETQILLIQIAYQKQNCG